MEYLERIDILQYLKDGFFFFKLDASYVSALHSKLEKLYKRFFKITNISLINGTMPSPVRNKTNVLSVFYNY